MVGPYSSTLSISDASPAHGGVYTCLARNKAASSNYSATLQVNGKRWSEGGDGWGNVGGGG